MGIESEPDHYLRFFLYNTSHYVVSDGRPDFYEPMDLKHIVTKHPCYIYFYGIVLVSDF